MSNNAQCYLMYVNDLLAGFMAVIHFPHPIVQNMWREHRTVILPEFQGLGLAKILRNTVAELYLKAGRRLTTTTNNPALCMSMKKDPTWICTRIGRVSGGKGKTTVPTIKNTLSVNRITTSWEYVGNKTNKG